MSIQITSSSTGVTFGLKVVPGASRSRIAGEYDGCLKITVAQAAEDGAANRAVVELLAEFLGIPARQVEIVKGQTQPRKVVHVDGLTVEQAREKLG